MDKLFVDQPSNKSKTVFIVYEHQKINLRRLSSPTNENWNYWQHS